MLHVIFIIEGYSSYFSCTEWLGRNPGQVNSKLLMGFCSLADSKCSMLFSSLKVIAPISLVLNDWIEILDKCCDEFCRFFTVHCDLTKTSIFE